MGRAEPETLGDSDIMAIMGSFVFCCFFMPCVGASLEQALKNYYPATNLQSPHLQSCGSLQKKINLNHQTDFILVCVCGKGANISKDDTDAESPTKFRQITKGANARASLDAPLSMKHFSHGLGHRKTPDLSAPHAKQI